MSRTIAILDGIAAATGASVRWLALGMLLLQFLIVVGRYVFGVNSIALQEGVLYLHATLFMLGAGYTLLVDGHVRVDVIYARLGDRAKRLIDLFGHFCLLIPSMVVLWYWSWPAVRNSWAILEGPLSVGGIKAVFLLKSLIPAFCLLLILQSLSQILKLLLRRLP